MRFTFPSSRYLSCFIIFKENTATGRVCRSTRVSDCKIYSSRADRSRNVRGKREEDEEEEEEEEEKTKKTKRDNGRREGFITTLRRGLK